MLLKRKIFDTSIHVKPGLELVIIIQPFRVMAKTYQYLCPLNILLHNKSTARFIHSL